MSALFSNKVAMFKVSHTCLECMLTLVQSMLISSSQHVHSLLILWLWQVIPAVETPAWIRDSDRERTAHHALPESREALRVAALWPGNGFW